MTTGQSPHPPSPSARARGVHDCNAQATWAKLKMCLFSQCHASFILSLFTCVMKLLIKYSPLIRVWVPGHLKYRIWETFGSQPVPAHRATLTLRDRRQTPSSSEYMRCLSYGLPDMDDDPWYVQHFATPTEHIIRFQYALKILETWWVPAKFCAIHRMLLPWDHCHSLIFACGPRLGAGCIMGV